MSPARVIARHWRMHLKRSDNLDEALACVLHTPYEVRWEHAVVNDIWKCQLVLGIANLTKYHSDRRAFTPDGKLRRTPYSSYKHFRSSIMLLHLVQ